MPQKPYELKNDEELMVLYQMGDYEAFETLYLRHKDRVYTYLRKRISDEGAIGEIFQNIFLKLHKQRQNYKPKFLFLKWLYTISRSELLDFQKKKQIISVPINEETLVTENLDSPSEISFDLQTVHGLTPREREALNLKYYSDLDYDEISKALKTSYANTRKIVSRAIGKLRKKIRRNEDHER